jgi:hypothetical protein
MLSEQEIRQALHADRVVPLEVGNPHGPLGLEHLAAAVSQIADSPLAAQAGPRVRQPVELPVETWERLDHLAQTASRPTTASQLAAVIVEQFVAAGRKDAS